MTEISLSFIFRLHRLFFGVSSAFPKERLLNFFAFYSAVFALTFSALPYISAESTFIFRCKLCIPLGTTFELLPVSFSFFLCIYIYIFGGYHSHRIEIRKITCCGPIKILSPLWKGKGCHKKE